MEQIRKNTETTTPQNLKDLATEFESLKSQPIEKANEWTVVNLRHIVGCGCGGSAEDIHIAFPGHHPNLENEIDSAFGGSVTDGEIDTLKGMYPDAQIMQGYSYDSGVTDQYDPEYFVAI